MRLGRVFLRPWAYWAANEFPPPPPSPAEALLLPVCIASYGAVMGRARSVAERQRAAELMLLEDGFEPAVASHRAAQLFPNV